MPARGRRLAGSRARPAVRRPDRPLSYVPIDLRGAALALIASLFWGANPVALKIGLASAPAIRMASFRFAVGGVVILLWAWSTGRLRGFRIAPTEWRPLGVLGILLTLQVGLMNLGIDRTTAAHAAIVLNLYAVHTVVLAHFMLTGDRLTPRRLTGVLVAYAGIVILFGRQAAAGAGTLLGDALVCVSALLLAERTIYMARAVQTLDPVKLLLAQAVMGATLFALLSALFEPQPTLWTGTLAASVAFQGVVVAGFNFIVNLWLLKRYRPSTLSALFLTQPIFGVVAAALLTGDPFTLDLLVATVAVAMGIGLTGR
jgi:drug/metabolite transporter (DMT)-like permease